MARDISEWLEDLGLGKYAKVFAENEIDLAAQPHCHHRSVSNRWRRR